MKRITISLSDELYRNLLDYAADQSKRNVKRLSLGEAVRTLISIQLDGFGYNRGMIQLHRVDAPRQTS